MLKIGLIGYGTHSKRLLEIINKSRLQTEIIYYIHREKNFLKKNKFFFSQTKKIKDLLFLDAIIIGSPNQTHIKYLNFFFKNNYKGYIFCEKPIAENKNKLIKIRKSLFKNYRKVFINFNQRYNPVTKCLKKIISDSDTGKVIYVNINISQGLAFTKKYINNWRSKEKKNSIVMNKSIHYIDLLVYLFGKPIKINNNLSNHANTGKPYDTNIIQFEFKKKIFANIFVSYSTPLNYEMQFILTNSIVNLRDERLSIIHPRDKFNKNGFFERPKEKILLNKDNFYERSLENSMKVFLNTVNKKKNFEKNSIISSYNSNMLSVEI